MSAPQIPDNILSIAEARMKQNRDRVMPPKFKHTIKLEWYRKFTFMERVRLFFGCNFVVLIFVASEHNPGKIQPIIAGNVSNTTSLDQHTREQMEQVVEQKKDDDSAA